MRMYHFNYWVIVLLLMTSCESELFIEEPNNDPVGNFESLWTTFDEKYAVFEQRNVDWQDQYDQFRPLVTQSTSDGNLFEVITQMLEPLDDGHVSLMANNRPFWSGNREFRERTRDVLLNLPLIFNNYLNGNFTNIRDQYYHGTVNGNIGYLWVANLSGAKPGFFDDFLTSHNSSIGLIIDLRHTNGGDFTNAEYMASRFADQKRLAFTAQPKNGTGETDFGQVHEYFLGPSGNSRFDKPVIVLTDEYTISAAENMVLYFMTLSNSTIIGQPTTGAMGERIEKEMPNGWVYSITAQLVTAPNGISYEGTGIPPDIVEENNLENLEAGVDDILERAIEELMD